jgi:hypothetical protein
MAATLSAGQNVIVYYKWQRRNRQMRLTDAQVAWNKLATEHNTLRNEIGVLIRRKEIVQKKSSRGAAVLGKAINEIVKLLIEVLAEMNRMEGPNDTSSRTGAIDLAVYQTEGEAKEEDQV